MISHITNQSNSKYAVIRYNKMHRQCAQCRQVKEDRKVLPSIQRAHSYHVNTCQIVPTLGQRVVEFCKNNHYYRMYFFF